MFFYSGKEMCEAYCLILVCHIMLPEATLCRKS